MVCPVADSFIANRPWDSRNGSEDFEAPAWAHRPLANILDRQDLSTKCCQARFKSINQALINRFKNEVCAIADQVMGANPGLKLLFWAVTAHAVSI